MTKVKTFEELQTEIQCLEKRFDSIVSKLVEVKELRNKLCPHTKKEKHSLGKQTWLRCTACSRNFDGPHEF